MGRSGSVSAHVRLLGAALIAVAIFGGCGGENTGANGTARRATSMPQRVSPPRPGGAPSTTTWTAPNADLHNTRHVGGPIEAATVSGLRRAWTMPLTFGYAATPVVSGGVAYTQDLNSNVYAIELKSGEVLWSAKLEEADIGPNGVNVADGRVYGATQRSAFALDQKTGKQLWSRLIALHPGDAIDMAPGYKDETVYVSTAVASPGAVGTLWAMDAATGRAKWKWAQVPEDLWGHPEVNAGGGLWHPPAFDDQGGLYISIANPLPFPGTKEAPWGASRPGANKWNNSIVKLDARTGKFLWGNQVLPHDIYDWDLECPVILARANGRRIALSSGKMGIVYAFDADTGKLLWKRPVGRHSGHDDDNLMAMHGRGDEIELPAKLLPGTWGGVESQMASDGTTVYVPVNNLWLILSSQTEARQQEITEGTGEIVAIDIASGQVKWDRKLPHSVYGAATVANDLVFTTTYEGKVWALNTATGETEWSSQMPAGSFSPVSVSNDMLITAANVALEDGQEPQIVAYRLGDGTEANSGQP